MRVVQVLTQATGGPCDHAADVALELTARGHTCDVVLREGPAARRLAAAGVQVHDLGPVGARDVRGSAALVRLLRRLRPDVVHCQDRRAGLVCRLAARSIRARTTVYTLHGVPDSMSGLVQGNLQVDPSRLGDRLLYLRAERALSAICPGPVVTPSAALADYATRQIGLPAARVHVVPNGVDVQRFRPGDRDRRSGSLDVLWLGAVVPTKRLDVLLRAVAAVPEVHVRLGGSGELEGELRRLADELGIAARVDWLGWVDDPAPLLAEADVLTLPSAAENLPLVVLQGLASGAVVVASRVGGLPEVIADEQNGLLVPPGDPVALAATLRRLVGDADLRSRLATAGRRAAVKRHSVESMTDRLLEVYA